MTARRWSKLVLRCATALKRSQSNLPCYISDSSVALQLTALGAEHAAEILDLSEKELPLSVEDSETSSINPLEPFKWALSTSTLRVLEATLTLFRLPTTSVPPSVGWP